MTSASPYSEAAPAGSSETNGLDVTAAAPEFNHLQHQPLPSLESCRWHGRPPAAGQLKVIVSQTAWQQLEGHSCSNVDTELGGALLGHAYQSDNQIFVEVLAAIPAVSQDHGPVHFTFTADAWSQLHRDREAQYPDLAIVGWFHTHPDLGVFFSADDVVVHSAAFALPWHVGLVVDPVRAEACFFGWANTSAHQGIVPLAGFYECLDDQPDSVVNWRITHQRDWHEPAQQGHVFIPANDWPALPPISPWWGVLLGGLSLIISLFLLLERLLAR